MRSKLRNEWFEFATLQNLKCHKGASSDNRYDSSERAYITPTWSRFIWQLGRPHTSVCELLRKMDDLKTTDLSKSSTTSFVFIYQCMYSHSICILRYLDSSHTLKIRIWHWALSYIILLCGEFAFFFLRIGITIATKQRQIYTSMHEELFGCFISQSQEIHFLWSSASPVTVSFV